MTAAESKKFDTDKPRWDLLPFKVLEPVVRVLTFGAKKYGDNNWQDLPAFESRYTAAFLRHFAAWQNGEKIDQESEQAHIAHAICNLIFLLWKEQQNESKLSVGESAPNKNPRCHGQNSDLVSAREELHKSRGTSN